VLTVILSRIIAISLSRRARSPNEDEMKSERAEGDARVMCLESIISMDLHPE
jgi:hypothetical protein